MCIINTDLSRYIAKDGQRLADLFGNHSGWWIHSSLVVADIEKNATKWSGASKSHLHAAQLVLLVIAHRRTDRPHCEGSWNKGNQEFESRCMHRFDDLCCFQALMFYCR
jgi:hypothetical protein